MSTVARREAGFACRVVAVVVDVAVAAAVVGEDSDALTAPVGED